MNQKQQLIAKIVHLLQTEFDGPASQVTSGDRAYLEQSSLSFLEGKLQQLQSEVTAKQQARALAQQDPGVQRAQAELAARREELEFESVWTGIVRTAIGDRVVQPNEANKAIIRGWINPGETPSFAWFKRILEENPSLVNQLLWDSTDKFDPVKRQQAVAAQLEQDRETFADACRRFQIGNNEANFGIIRETLGEGFSVYQIQQAVQSGAVRVSSATHHEIGQWAAEAVETHNDFLLQADTSTLKTLARREGADTRAAAAQQQADRQFEAAKIRDAAIGYPALPGLWRGQKLDAEFIKRADPSTLKFLRQRFGAAAVDARLRGIS
jgi:hypothetical protein